MHSLRPGLGCESMAVAMARKQPGHIQRLQSFQRTDLHAEIPPAVTLGTDENPLLTVPLDVIAAEQHAALIPQQQGHGTGRVTGSGHELKLRCQSDRLLAVQDLLRRWSGIGIAAVNPALTTERISPTLMLGHIITVGQHNPGQAAHGPDPPGQRSTPTRDVDHDVAIGSLNQPAAGSETAPGGPAAVVDLTGGMAADPERKAMHWSGALQGTACFDRGDRAGLQGEQRLTPGRLVRGLLASQRCVGAASKVKRIKGPTGAAVNAPVIDAERRGL